MEKQTDTWSRGSICSVQATEPGTVDCAVVQIRLTSGPPHCVRLLNTDRSTIPSSHASCVSLQASPERSNLPLNALGSPKKHGPRTRSPACTLGPRLPIPSSFGRLARNARHCLQNPSACRLCRRRLLARSHSHRAGARCSCAKPPNRTPSILGCKDRKECGERSRTSRPAARTRMDRAQVLGNGCSEKPPGGGQSGFAECGSPRASPQLAAEALLDRTDQLLHLSNLLFGIQVVAITVSCLLQKIFVGNVARA